MNAASFSAMILKINAETGRTIKKIMIPETRCEIDSKADNGS
jgi:hypothetical protein